MYLSGENIMIYVSIPVHEKLPVIKDQADNFAKFFPEAKIVLHVSTQATFSLEEINKFVKENAINNVLINPVQVDTQWGSIIRAHLQNIKFILEKGDAIKVCFHSSNDMLVRPGLSEFLKDKDYVYHHRIVRKNSYWWVGNVALNDYRLMDWLAIHGGGAVIASQIEGSVYHIHFLEELLDELLNCHPVLESDLFYPREEILFSSFAVAKGLKPQGLPYILSEVHRFDKNLWSRYDQYSYLLDESKKWGRFLKKKLNDKMFNSDFYKISKLDIDAIRGQDVKYLAYSSEMSDGGNLWKIHDVQNLFGVKRVERDMKNPIRQYIATL